MEMDTSNVPLAAFAKERQKTEILAQEIRSIRQRLEASTRISATTVSDFPSGSLGEKYGTIGARYKSVR